MTFTDEDLRLVKEDIKKTRYGFDDFDHSGIDDLEALIHRLEAAEKVIYVMGSDPLSGKVGKAYEAWRKSKGEK